MKGNNWIRSDLGIIKASRLPYAGIRAIDLK